MEQASTGRGTLVRVSTTTITKRSVSNFLKMYELRILPLYKSLPGILSNRLYIEDTSINADPTPTSSTTKPNLNNSSSTPKVEYVQVQSITEWTTYDDMMEATVINPSSNYTESMKELSTYFHNIPQIYLMTQAINYDLRYSNNNNNTNTKTNKNKHKVQDNQHEPGPELGLR